jgi:hypothetical protein
MAQAEHAVYDLVLRLYFVVSRKDDFAHRSALRWLLAEDMKREDGRGD